MPTKAQQKKINKIIIWSIAAIAIVTGISLGIVAIVDNTQHDDDNHNPSIVKDVDAKADFNNDRSSVVMEVEFDIEDLGLKSQVEYSTQVQWNYLVSEENVYYADSYVSASFDMIFTVSHEDFFTVEFINQSDNFTFNNLGFREESIYWSFDAKAALFNDPEPFNPDAIKPNPIIDLKYDIRDPISSKDLGVYLNYTDIAGTTSLVSETDGQVKLDLDIEDNNNH
jgi:hypothetical protein